MRLPVCALSKKHMASRETWDALMEVIAWSFKCLASGQFPSKRHTGEAWTQKDTYRKKLGGKPIGLKAVLAEVRADWQFLSQVFAFPAHNLGAGNCWKCRVTPQTMKDFSLTAAWRQPENRLSHWDLLSRWHQQGVRPSPLFGAPFLVSQCFAIDWLHAVDQGVGPDYLGNLFWHVLPQLPGNNRKEKVSSLFMKIDEFYRRQPTDSRLDDLTALMIKAPKKGPKLRSKAAEARGLIPFGLELANELLGGDDQVNVAIRGCAKHLMEAYNCLSVASFSSETLQTHVRQFLVLYCALEASSKDKLWSVKPKFHLFAELANDGNCPSLQWTYRDEDYGGTAARVAHRRGGKNSALSMGSNFLLKFYAKNRIPTLGAA